MPSTKVVSPSGAVPTAPVMPSGTVVGELSRLSVADSSSSEIGPKRTGLAAVTPGSSATWPRRVSGIDPSEVTDAVATT